MSNIPGTNIWNNPDWNTSQKALGLGSIGSGLFGMFGPKSNPMNEANKYYNQIPGQTQQYMQPYFNAGTSQLPGLSEQYGQLMNDPGGKFNQIGEGFHQSPGFKFALEQALGSKDRSNNAGGMLGSPMNTQQDMELATNLANQDYYNYMNGATGLYGQGLTGGQNMANQGQQAGQNYSDQIANILAQQGQMGWSNAMQQNQNKGGAFSDILSGIGSFFL